jgi:hypothetical protein
METGNGEEKSEQCRARKHGEGHPEAARGNQGSRTQGRARHQPRRANWDVIISPPISAEAKTGTLLTRQTAELKELYALLD